jgi:hypothetical protein
MIVVQSEDGCRYRGETQFRCTELYAIGLAEFLGPNRVGARLMTYRTRVFDDL